MDKTDIALLAELQRNGRISNTELAEKVRLSPSACLRRVQKLEADGVIAGYMAQLDPIRLGLGLQAFVRVQLTAHDGDAIERFVERIERWDEVVACYALTGDMDYLLQIVVADLDHFSQVLLDRLLKSGGVGDVNTSFVLRTVKPPGGLPLNAVS
ncbi:MAG: Lrp/AsnC family transcriptional regulator [Rhodanobacteraceae bacterium]|nr:Lrp/AsnC family transcriptional regulator [Xanthomonadales bacterium]MCP5479738.1 Lrp/AsnC family transcriptional regulator [Rhodanobacteraceae bacterium]HPF72097.1 Lrp/AsnC family transcriptional regulator [Xanthomonadaceae bacterium]HRX99173.1 Lrp/AsnC family transcriptional regulator [Xanthomonadaceae bacterium]